ncbi:MAG: hypothetical protein ACQEQG_10690 [Bacillota bacterium]
MKLRNSLFQRNHQIRENKTDFREENIQKVLKETGDYMMYI